jgi:hypothetical protein
VIVADTGAILALLDTGDRHHKAIATLDLTHFGAVKIAGSPRLLPRDATST